MCNHNITRRQFLKGTAAAAAFACCPEALGPLSPTFAYGQSAGNGRFAVLFNQYGGNDHLNSWAIPYSVSAYYDRRVGLAVPANTVLPLANGIGLNPVFDQIYSLYQAGNVAIIQGIGDPQNTRSHFTAQENMSRGIGTGAMPTEQRGWVGRFGDLNLQDLQFNTLGLGVGAQTDFGANRTSNRPIITSRLSSYGFQNDNTSTNDNLFRRRQVRNLLNAEKDAGERGNAVRVAQKQMYTSVDKISQSVTGYSNAITYPNTTPGVYLRDVGIMVEAAMDGIIPNYMTISYGGMGGWDTHATQRTQHDQRLNEIDNAVFSWSQDMKRLGQWNNALFCVFTEFGRNSFVNASGGTDHGWGSAMALIGGGVRGGVYGATPSDNELRTRPWAYMDIDFRSVFYEIVQWLGYNPAPVFPENFSRVNLGLFL